MKAKVFMTRLGWMAAASNEEGVCAVIPPDGRRKVESKITDLAGGCWSSSPLLERLSRDINRYLSGRRVDFKRYRTAPLNATDFRLKVWSTVRRIPYGSTATYGGLAETIGCGDASRAVGGALNANRLPIIIPCHRVVSSKGLGGFSAGSDLKRELLILEGAI